MTHHTGSVPETPRPAMWSDQAACIGEDPAPFHAGERNPEAVKQARSICSHCTVRTACLLAAYAEGDEWAIRAGLTPRQRNAFLKKADGNIARAVADALEDTVVLLRAIYRQHAQPDGNGHMVWTDHRQFVFVRAQQYTPHRVAWYALHGGPPVGTVWRLCEVEGCVAEACLTDRAGRERAAARKKVTA